MRRAPAGSGLVLLALALASCTGPVIEVLAQGPGNATDLAVLLSGDGGWAGFDQALSAALAARGVPVVGLNSLRYFWQKRRPKDAAADLSALIQAHLAAWGRTRAILIGYSFGGDVLPFLVNRMDPVITARIPALALIAPTAHAAFELKLWEWLGGEEGLAHPVAPELARVKVPRILCIHGTEDAAAICPALPQPVRIVAFPGGHQLTEKAGEIAQTLIDAAGR